VFKKLFPKKPQQPELDPLRDLVLDKLRVGFLLDYDLKTWQVTTFNRYLFDGDDEVKEWELTSGHEKRYLERGEDDGPVWSLARKIPLGTLTTAHGSLKSVLSERDTPPEKVVFENNTFYLDEDTAGYFYPGGTGEGTPLIKWEFISEDASAFVTVEQWGETDFEASASVEVAEYQFTNILPAPPEPA
jgi:hypothetical protein